jgi:hypothetical protein
MRPWIEYLITNPSAGADFIEWTHDIDAELKKKLALAVRADEIEKARALASELNVYDTIRKKVETEMRERASQIKYSTENEGG